MFSMKWHILIVLKINFMQSNASVAEGVNKMRDRKFRALSLNGSGWVYGYLIYKKTFPSILTLNKLIEIPIRLNTEGQYTGLKDKNEKEIYEGDIVSFCVENQISGGWTGGNIGVITWDKKRLLFGIKLAKNPNVILTINHSYDAYSGSMEVKGNIYENEELLENV